MNCAKGRCVSSWSSTRRSCQGCSWAIAGWLTPASLPSSAWVRPRVLAHPAQFQLPGELGFDRYPEYGALAGLQRPRRPRRQHALLQVRLEPKLQGFLRVVLDVVAGRRESVAASACREVRQQVLALFGYDRWVPHAHLRKMMPGLLRASKVERKR